MKLPEEVVDAEGLVRVSVTSPMLLLGVLTFSVVCGMLRVAGTGKGSIVSRITSKRGNDGWVGNQP